jgi:hypothetical protein
VPARLKFELACDRCDMLVRDLNRIDAIVRPALELAGVPHEGASLDTLVERLVLVASVAREMRPAQVRSSSRPEQTVMSACNVLGIELPESADLDVSCERLTDTLDQLVAWARKKLPTAALWDRSALDDCPLIVPDLDVCRERALDRTKAVSDPAIWESFADTVRCVVDGEDASALALWISVETDASDILAVVLDRVEHLEGKLEDRKVDRTLIAAARPEYAEDVARRLYEVLPLGVELAAVERVYSEMCDQGADVEQTEDIRKALARTRAPRNLEAWCALHPSERNRFVDRTRDVLQAVSDG